jgi:protein tyrosine phosphatase (PTP) superfamily phosphohydrolase (DUF442 family)
MRSMLARLCLAASLAAAPVHAQTTQVRTTQPPTPDPASGVPADLPGLHNVVAFAPGVYSGSVPEGDAGFDSLRSMGIRTIISVDGASPDVAAAEARSIRYVHLPITYSGMTEQRKLEIARAMRDLPHPLYIHCHHGKHRSAAAAGAALVSLGILSPDQAQARMKVSGTAPSYKGLWSCVALSTLASPEALDAADASFPKTWKTSGPVQAMVEIDEINDHLKLIEAAGWAAPKDHPDLVPAAEAGRMADLFRNLHASDELKSEPADLLAWLDRAGAEAAQLEDAIVAGKPASELSAAFKIVAKSCKDCHAKHRD